jgi:DNA N-6-adenine-methyltransferase (Dam)
MLDSVDADAVAIGLLHQKAQAPGDGRLFYLFEAGSRLLKKKESLTHGQWRAWITANSGLLELGDQRARTLIAGAQWLATNWRLADALEDIVTDPQASASDLARADEIRQLIGAQFRPDHRGTLAHRRQKNEWYTPAPYIARARAVLGDIDVDPASSARAQQTVQARRYFDKEQNGLRQAWPGRVWLNPPYSPPLIGKFVNKLLMEWGARRMTACIALTHNYTDSTWFHDVLSAADAVCFTHGRVKFYDPEGVLANPSQGQTFFYFGDDTNAFKREFAPVGSIVKLESDAWRVRDEASAITN